MPVAVQADEAQADARRTLDRETISTGVSLLSQQIWCWGQDILRPQGNWLTKVGFQKLAAPADRDNCSSVYTLDLPQGRRVVLRGFGVFYGDDQHGGVFLQRYEFEPRYTPHAALECPPWSTTDLPALKVPTDKQRASSTALTLGLVDWIRAYEANVAEQLGIAYRQATIDRWSNSKQPIVSAAEMANAWQSLGVALGG